MKFIAPSTSSKVVGNTSYIHRSRSVSLVEDGVTLERTKATHRQIQSSNESVNYYLLYFEISSGTTGEPVTGYTLITVAEGQVKHNFDTQCGAVSMHVATRRS